MLGAGFLYRLGQFSLLPMYLILLIGDFVADVAWYAVGYYGAAKLLQKYGKFFNITPEIIRKIEMRFKRFSTSILIISKLTMGFGFALATLLVAGMLKVPFKKYVALNLLGGIVWTGVMITIGYFFGNIYLLVSEPYKIAFVVFAIVLVIATLRWINRYLVNTEI